MVTYQQRQQFLKAAQALAIGLVFSITAIIGLLVIHRRMHGWIASDFQMLAAFFGAGCIAGSVAISRDSWLVKAVAFILTLALTGLVLTAILTP